MIYRIKNNLNAARSFGSREVGPQAIIEVSEREFKEALPDKSWENLVSKPEKFSDSKESAPKSKNKK